MASEPTLSSDLTLADVVRLLPAAIAVFEETEIDYSCQGGRSLGDAAKDAGYQTADIITRLEAARSVGGFTNWFDQTLTALMQYLTSDHRATIGRRIPRLRQEIDQAIAAVGESNELQRIRILFAHLANAVSTHVLNEERELFPFITHLDAANNDALGAPPMRISQRVLRELVEHETFRDRLRTLRELLGRLPNEKSVVALRDDLFDFSNEVHRHMHLENNVLYPRAIEIENSLRRSRIATA